jgi:hypothetical protein
MQQPVFVLALVASAARVAAAQPADPQPPAGDPAPVAPGPTTPVAPAPATPEPAAPVAPAPSIKLAGYIEAFYQYNFNRPSNLITAYRGFDDRTNSFTISNAVLDVTGQIGKVSTRLALQVGHAPISYYASEPQYAAQAGTGATGPELWRLIQQAILGYKIDVGRGLLAEAGIFLSPIGLENLPIKDQWNWSRSDLFFALPFYHAGVRFTYPLSDELTGVLYATNGWNDIVNRNPYPCFAGILSWTPSPALSANVLYFGGVEPFHGAPEGQPWRHLFDLTATWTVTPTLSLAMQADAGFEPNNFGTSRWAAAAVNARVQPRPWLYVAARGDYFHEYDAHDATGAAARLFFPADNVESATLTADLRPEDSLSLRIEYRYDHGDAAMYFHGEVPIADAASGTSVPTARSQQTLTLGAVTWF